MRFQMRALAREFSLIMTGGSDFHGLAIKPDVRIGMETPPEGCVRAAPTRRAVRYPLNHTRESL
ncbi:MAG: hypothetical protein IPK17_39615 [Chloroflexi bacterium]|uniref:hypothetical protein n=1 Tax=Candidatus Flexifilum breve TaxID=3140694 RepID=UPI003135C992|nr:hypothetical protein [Chloroflexota bacterium]